MTWTWTYYAVKSIVVTVKIIVPSGRDDIIRRPFFVFHSLLSIFNDISSLQHTIRRPRCLHSLVPTYNLTMLSTRITPLVRSPRSMITRGYASHGPSYNEPSGYLFGERVCLTDLTSLSRFSTLHLSRVKAGFKLME